MSNLTLAQWRSIETKDEILKKDLSQKDEKLKDAFTTSIEFGTAGLRGIMGAGTNKMNVFTIAAAAEAYAKYLIQNIKGAKKSGVVIGHDNRHNSALFSETTAKVLENKGIRAYLFQNNDLQPTPLVSYVIRKMGLAGGVVITASHNPKEYNGFKVYNNLGGQLMSTETRKIQEFMKEINPLSVERETDKQVSFVDAALIDEYISDVLSVRKTNIKLDGFKIAFTAQHGTSAVIGPILLRKMGAEVLTVDKQQTPDPNFKYTKTPNPEDAKSYKKAFLLARAKKADMIISTDPDSDRIGIAVKYQRRYKFLDGNQTATIYLDYLLSHLKKEGKIPKDGYIVTTHVSGDLPEKIARKYNVKTIRVHVGFKNVADVIDKTKGTFIFGFEESYGSLINPNFTRDKDSFQAMVAYAEMLAFYKSQGSDAYTELKNLYHEFGIHRNSQTSRKLDKEMTDRLLNRLLKLKKVKIGDKKVSEVQDFRDEAGLVKVHFDDGSWFAVRPSGTEAKVKIYTQIVGTKQQELMDVVYFEKQLSEWIRENTEEFVEAKFKWTTFFKYFLFIGITVATFMIVFFAIYSGSQSAIDDGKSALSVVTIAGNMFNSVNRGIWFAMWGWTFINNAISAWAMKRSLQMQGEKAKVIDLAVAALMGSIVSFLTPFAVGGDAISYWYMRRKGIKRGPLIASYMTDTLLYQAKFTLQTIFLVSIGWGVYKDIFGLDDAEAHAALIWFFVGMSWMIFSTFMIFMIMLGKRFQEFIVRNSVKYLEWSRFATITDPGSLSAGYMYEFKMVRNGMKDIWGKHWWFPIEMIAYRLIPLFFAPSAIILAQSGWINPNVSAGTYWSQIVVGDIVGTANSMSLTPGGSGTGEWLSIVTNKLIYKDSYQLNHMHDLYKGTNIDVRQIASGADFMWKVISTWPWLMFSALTAVGMIILENRRIRVSKINKNNVLNNKQLRGDTKVKWYVYSTFILFWIILAILHFFVFFK